MENLIKNEFIAIPHDEVFATGTIENSPKGVYMTNSNIGEMLRWVAKKGDIDDWCIYIHWERYDVDFVARHGDKIMDLQNVQKLIPCDIDVLELYRM